MSIAAEQLEQHRPALTGHCYRMMGSAMDADDAVQETLVRAWKNLERFDQRASLRTWLYRIATNVCLDMLAERKRRVRPMDNREAGNTDAELTTLDRTHWLEPIPDARVIPENADPSEMIVLRQSIRLAFVAALQHLPPKQRAVLLLTEVLGWSAAEVAESIDSSVASVNSALQRARATLGTRAVTDQSATLTDEQKKLIDDYVAAFLRYDVDTLVSLLHKDATLSMPPFELWLRGPDDIAVWLAGRGSGCRGSKLIPTSACGMPAFAQYRCNPEGGYKAWGLIVLELKGDRIASWNSFLDTEKIFPLFGMPLTLPA